MKQHIDALKRRLDELEAVLNTCCAENIELTRRIDSLERKLSLKEKGRELFYNETESSIPPYPVG